MRNSAFRKQAAVSVILLSFWLLPLASTAQTRVDPPKNKYKLQDDIKLGNDAAKQVEQQFPILNDDDATRYVAHVGQRLVDSIPPELQQPAFQYRFKIVNASDINAFALPGGPMFVNRGMIQAAKNEGEMAGVMAHEISHVVLRHATAQATKQNSVGNQIGIIGMILGGAILGGQAGAELGAAGAMAWMTKYSRQYETQADVLGSHIMANAGYDPHDLANMFKTISEQGGAKVPQWLSDHPDPGNRYNNINQEASLLNISKDPIKITRDFERVQARLKGMPKAKSMAEIERDIKNKQGAGTTGTANGRYSNNIETPSTSMRQYSSGNLLRMSVPSNWREFPGGTDVQFAPEGAYGDQGITRGAMVGIVQGQNADLAADTDAYVNDMLQGNSYLQKRGDFSTTYVAGKRAYMITLSGRSPVTGRTEVVTIYTVKLNSGSLFYFDTVSPDSESGIYYSAFRNMLRSISLNDR